MSPEADRQDPLSDFTKLSDGKFSKSSKSCHANHHTCFRTPFGLNIGLPTTAERTSGQHWYKPPDSPSLFDSSTTSPAIQPDLIILCAWAFAAPKHILKYIVQHRVMYPQAQILLLQNSLANLAFTP